MTSFESVLITGGAGYVGSVLTNELVKKKIRVKVIDSLVFGDSGISTLIDSKEIEFFNIATCLNELNIAICQSTVFLKSVIKWESVPLLLKN